MVVSSQPHVAPMTPSARHTPIHNGQPSYPAVAQSPRPIPQHIHSYSSTASPPPPAPVTESLQEKIDVPTTPLQSKQPSVQSPLALAPEYREPYWPKLPWYSVPESQDAFPARAAIKRRRRRHAPFAEDAVALPARSEVDGEADAGSAIKHVDGPQSDTSTIAPPSEFETPATSAAPSESDVTQVSTPTTPAHATSSSPKPTPTQQHVRRDTRTAIAVPIIPSLARPKDSPTARINQDNTASEAPSRDGLIDVAAQSTESAQEADTPQTPPPKVLPKSWADLVRRTNGTNVPVDNSLSNDAAAPTLQLPKSASLAEALRQYSVQNDTRLSFLEPRGLVNTGNMCYMNSILQVLMFCAPFYNFLDQVRQRTVHSLKSETPLLDAMIIFMQEFNVLASAESPEALRKVLKQDQLETYGDPVTPEYVYDVIRKLPRFSGMRRGHQQDAEEFLGFLLEGMHDECVQVIQGQPEGPAQNGSASPELVSSPSSAEGWLEVGPKQRAAVTRTAGHDDAPSPVTKIFGGNLRSELRVTGNKDSVTFEPYKPLQLDIGAPSVNNIIDALRGLTRTEALTGDFGGKGNTTAKKQVFIDTLPPVLILHLKRFQYDSSFSGTQKIWKKVGYPLELEIPKEVFPPAKRGGLAVKGGAPHYRLTSVVYHHGKSAAGGHYTVDVLRQDSQEWVRMDDTVIRRVRPEDVAEGGAEEDPKVLAKALEQHKNDSELPKPRNIFQGLDEADNEPDEDLPWNEVNGVGSAKKWNGVAASATPTNGVASPGGRKPVVAPRKENVRDNKVAYILLYERIRS